MKTSIDGDLNFVRNSRVSARRELTVLLNKTETKLKDITEFNSINNTYHPHPILQTLHQDTSQFLHRKLIQAVTSVASFLLELHSLEVVVGA